MYCRHDRNTKVHVSSFVTNPKAAVLRHTTFGDIQFRHHLDARDQCLVISQIDRIHLLIQRTVNAVFHLDFGIACFDVNVGSARLHSVVNDRVDQLDDGRHLAVGRQAIEIKNLFSLLSLAHQRDAKS